MEGGVGERPGKKEKNEKNERGNYILYLTARNRKKQLFSQLFSNPSPNFSPFFPPPPSLTTPTSPPQHPPAPPPPPTALSFLFPTCAPPPPRLLRAWMLVRMSCWVWVGILLLRISWLRGKGKGGRMRWMRGVLRWGWGGEEEEERKKR